MHIAPAPVLALVPAVAPPDAVVNQPAGAAAGIAQPAPTLALAPQAISPLAAVVAPPAVAVNQSAGAAAGIAQPAPALAPAPQAIPPLAAVAQNLTARLGLLEVAIAGAMSNSNGGLALRIAALEVVFHGARFV